MTTESAHEEEVGFLHVRVREMDQRGDVAARDYDYPLSKLSDMEIDSKGVTVEFHDGTQFWHNNRYVEWAWTEKV